MGKIKQGILGAFSGKVAGVVGSSWKGIAVMKALPPSVANPKTAPQMAQRNKFSQAVAVATMLLSIFIKPLWDRFAQQMSGYNAFLKANIDAFDASGLATPAEFILSEGKMSATTVDDVTYFSATGDIKVDWTDDSGSGFKQETDETFALAYNETQGKWYWPTETNVRTAGAAVCWVPEDSPIVDGDTIHAYLAFRRDDGTVVSDTGYATADVTV